MVRQETARIAAVQAQTRPSTPRYSGSDRRGPYHNNDANHIKDFC
jgi:hypothetical protein